ncbi:MAG: response regulator transcription factor [Lachnospiraceae bacterium]|nr:response regulator transcription factor [Lachnospiraceae bacterium]MBQ8546921.1 response regulator transcription factor [Lachnospiraceae bacterium]
MRIGICDDEKHARMEVRKRCELYFNENKIEHDYIEFESGEAVLAYSAKQDSASIDLLFLDVEMEGLDGIRLKEQLLRQRAIERIVFVTSHKDKVFDAFGQKTIGFISKPPTYERIEKMLTIVREEKLENVELVFDGYKGKQHHIRLEEIAYFKADGSYTEIFSYTPDKTRAECFVISKKIGEVEQSMKVYSVLRVHKSFLVNLANVASVGEEIKVRDLEEKIPIGRKYKEQVKRAYTTYISDKVRKRI